MTQLDRIETACIHNRALLVAIADVLIAEHGYKKTLTKQMKTAIGELQRAIHEARPWRK